MIPWVGVWFWVLLWVFVVVSNPSGESSNQPGPKVAPAPDLELAGLNIRQKTVYTDHRFTWMDLYAQRGTNVEGDEGTHRLSDVRVKVVIKDLDNATSEEKLSDLSQGLDIAWFLIEADTGTYSLNTQNIYLEGDAQVYGYSLDGTLTEWISAERLLYDCENGQVRSIGPAVYEGQAYPGRPCKGVFTAGLDLSQAEIVVEEFLDLRTFQTPIRHPALRPPYDPPEALRFLRGELPANRIPG